MRQEPWETVGGTEKAGKIGRDEQDEMARRGHAE